MFLNNLRKSKGIFWFIALLLILAVSAFLFFKFKPTERRPQKLNAYTKKVITKYASDLVSNIDGITEPFNLGLNAKNTLEDIISALETDDEVIIFNGQVFYGLEVVDDYGVYYLKPVGFDSYDYNDYLEIIRKEDVKPQEFYDAIDDPVQKEIIKIFYDDFTYGEETIVYQQVLPQEPSYEGREEHSGFISEVKGVLGLEGETVSQPVKVKPQAGDLETRLKSFLDLKVRDGALKGYDYDSEHDSLALTYEGDNIPWLLNPALYAQAMDYVITAYADPREFSQQTLDEYNQKLARGDVLIINTKAEPAFYDFFNRDILKDNLKALVDGSLSRDEKMEKISGGILYIDPDEFPFQNKENVYLMLNTDLAWADDSQGDITQLLNRERVITPPSKDIYIIQMADYIPSQEIKRLKGESNRALDYLKVSFDPYIKNGYNIRVLSYRWADHSIEKLAEILSDQKISVVVLNTHGVYDGEGIYFLYGELYDANTKDAERIFDKRLEQLWGKPYGSSGIAGYYRTVELSDSDKYILFRHEVGLAGALKSFFDLPVHKRKFGVIGIRKDFFKHFFNENSSYKKAVFIAYVCYSWELTDSINARIFLAPSKGTVATREHFVESDLIKLAPYLLKNEDPGPVKITSENMRNYDILKSFRQEQIMEDKGFQTDKWKFGRFTCVNQKDRLCNLRLFSPHHETVSVSPHVQHAGPTKIEFNVPMDVSISADKVVTIDCSECEISKKELARLKPKWSGDKSIILPWNNKAYRAWSPADLTMEQTRPPLAKITVHQDKALSKLSNINLTGNSDCCDGKGCKTVKCWDNPTLIKYNANHPKTDFVYFMPCPGAYYKACKEEVKPEYLKVVTKEITEEYTQYIIVSGDCYKKAELSEEEKKLARGIQTWGEGGKRCFQECGKKCGDNICSDDEDCKVCPDDCGECSLCDPFYCPGISEQDERQHKCNPLINQYASELAGAGCGDFETMRTILLSPRANSCVLCTFNCHTYCEYKQKMCAMDCDCSEAIHKEPYGPCNPCTVCEECGLDYFKSCWEDCNQFVNDCVNEFGYECIFKNTTFKGPCIPGVEIYSD